MRSLLKTMAVILFLATSALTQTISTAAGGGITYLANGIPATAARFYGPTAVAVDSSGNLYIADCNPSSGYGAVIYKVAAATGTITKIAGTGVGGYTGDGGAATSATFSNLVYGLAVAPSGNVYVSDDMYAVVRKITVSTGIISTYAGYNPSKSQYFGGFNGDGQQATSTWLSAPGGIYVDSASLYIADSGNRRVRKVNSSGIVSTVAGNGTQGYTGDGGAATSAQMDNPSGVSLDPVGNIYITDLGLNGYDSTVRKVTVSTGIITTFAGQHYSGINGDGGYATSAELNVPHNLAFDSLGNLFIADTYNNKVRVVDTNLIINTFAGTGGQGFSGDGGLATNAQLIWPYAVASDLSGNVYIADYRNLRIRKVH